MPKLEYSLLINTIIVHMIQNRNPVYLQPE